MLGSMVGRRRWLLLVAGAAIAAVGCAAGAGPPAPARAPTPRPAACSPGWTVGAEDTCQRDPSNFGGRGAGVGAQRGG
jgi:hypothetical protein